MAIDLISLLPQVEELVNGAAGIMTSEEFDIQEKGSCINICTSSDIKVQEYLKERLCDLVEDSGFFGEEGAQLDKDKKYVWIVDPIDGTMNYARGIPDCAISVALVSEGKALLGVVCCPYHNKTFTAVSGMGAWCNGKAIRVSGASYEQGILCTAMSLYRKDLAGVCSRIIDDIYSECNDFRRFGSCAVELCYLASGLCDLYFEIRVFPWDYAASMLILTEAGGYIGSLGAEPLGFDRATPVIAANSKDNFDRIVKTVAKYIDKAPYEEKFFREGR